MADTSKGGWETINWKEQQKLADCLFYVWNKCLVANLKLVRWGFVIHGGIDGYSSLRKF